MRGRIKSERKQGWVAFSTHSRRNSSFDCRKHILFNPLPDRLWQCFVLLSLFCPFLGPMGSTLRNVRSGILSVKRLAARWWFQVRFTETKVLKISRIIWKIKDGKLLVCMQNLSALRECQFPRLYHMSSLLPEVPGYASAKLLTQLVWN